MSDRLYYETITQTPDGPVTSNNGGTKDEYIRFTPEPDGWIRVQGFLRVDNEYIKELFSKVDHYNISDYLPEDNAD